MICSRENFSMNLLTSSSNLSSPSSMQSPRLMVLTQILPSNRHGQFFGFRLRGYGGGGLRPGSLHVFIAGRGDFDRFAAGGAFDLRAGETFVCGQVLAALRTVEV